MGYVSKTYLSTQFENFATRLAQVFFKSEGFGYGQCSTASDIVAKTVTLEKYGLTKNGIVSINFTNAVPSNATLNINSKGAKPIYYHGTALTTNIINAGDTATFIYDGTRYQLISIDTRVSSSGGGLIWNKVTGGVIWR